MAALTYKQLEVRTKYFGLAPEMGIFCARSPFLEPV